MVVGKTAVLAEDAEGFGVEHVNAAGADFTVFADAKAGTVRQTVECGDVREVIPLEEGVVVRIGRAKGTDGKRARLHDIDGTRNRVRGIAHWGGLQPAFVIGGYQGRKLLADLSCPAGLVDLAEIATAIDIVRVFSLRIDEFTELSLCGEAAANHRLRAVDGGLPEHILLASALDGLSDFHAPLKGLVGIGKRNQGDGAIDMLARVQHLKALWCVKPGLRDNDDGIDI